jgi:PAS domain S-box-containing protein
MARDISARKLAEARSWKNQQLMEFLLKSSPIVFYTCNIEDGYAFTYVSPNVEELFGYPPDAITQASAFLLRHVHPDDHDQVQSSRASLMHHGRENLEYRLQLPDGSYHWLNDSHTMVNGENGKPSLLIGRWTDINERKEAEVELALQKESLNISFKCARLAGWDWTINTGKMAWSGQINEQLGFSAAQIADFDDLSAIAHPEDRDRLMAAFRQCLVQDEPLDIEFRILRADKRIHWIHLVGESVDDESGSPVRMVGALSDVTAQKQLRVASSRQAKQAV